MPKESSTLLSYNQALEDFQAARRKAALEAVLARVSGRSENLLSYDEIRAKLGGIETSYREIKDIPLDAIVGTVNRYADFTRSLLPRNVTNQERWARVRVAAEQLEGLPPIEVYQIGDAYFILDGHHRASVARELGAKSIQAYVRVVRTIVPLSLTDKVENIIIKAEYSEFLNKTRLHEIRPMANLEVTAPGQYEKLLEHISVHRYYLGIDEKREIRYEEAVTHWFDAVYQPVAWIIRQRNLLRDFPGRTETDLYLWIMEHRAGLESEFGWKVEPQAAAADLIQRFRPGVEKAVYRFFQRIYLAIMPEEIEAVAPPGEWRRLRAKDKPGQSLFHNVMVAVPGDEGGWKATRLAAEIAGKENGILGGLHIVPLDQAITNQQSEAFTYSFEQTCQEKSVEGSLVIEKGQPTKVILERSTWADLVVVRMLYPPPFSLRRRLRSGLRTLIRLCRSPLLIAPPDARDCIQNILLLYGGGPRADEALFVAAYLTSKWGVGLRVVAVDRGRPGDESLIARAQVYLEAQDISTAQYTFEKDEPAKAVLRATIDSECDLIVMGGYEKGLVMELLTGSTVDQVLWSTRLPVLICQ